MGERAEPHALVVGAGDHRRVCAIEAPADAVVAGVDSAAGRHGGGGAEGERVHEKRTSGDMKLFYLEIFYETLFRNLCIIKTKII